MEILEFKNKNKSVGKMEYKNSNGVGELYIYGDIVSSEWGKWESTDICPQDISDFLSNLNGINNINIYVNSGGGDVFAGLAIYNQLRRNPANKTVYVDGLAASISSVIALAGDKVIIPSNAQFMIHKPWSGLMGNSTDFRKMADTLDNIEQSILNVYAEHLKDGVSIEEIKNMVDSETWLTGDKVAEYFNVDIGKELKIVASVSSKYFNEYKNTPDDLKPLEKPLENIINNTENSIEKEKLLIEIDLI